MGYDHTQIAFSRITLVDGYYYDKEGAPLHGQSVQYFALKEPNKGLAPEFNFTDYTPVLILIELGTNDRNLGVPEKLFKSTYVKFVEDIKAKYPSAKIVLFRNSFCNQFSAAVFSDIFQYLQAAGYTGVFYIEPANWITQADKLDGCHPSIAGHQKIADSLVVRLKEILK
jgi:lysophospholipase L1-like esterase